jgi:hypothetical protein
MTVIKFLFVVSLVFGMAAPKSIAQTEELINTVTATARMKYGDRQVNIHPMLSNLKSPADQWQFRYKPLLLPETDEQGKLVVTKSGQGATWTVSVRIWFDNQKAQAAALQAVKTSYPADAPRIHDSHVGRIPISNVKFTVNHPGGNWTSELFNPGEAQSRTVSIAAHSKDEAAAIEAWLRGQGAVVRIEYKYGTRALQENSTVVKMTHLINTRLHQKLDGLPKENGHVYVHRDQIGELCSQISGQLNKIDWVEKPETFDSAVVEGLIHLWKDQRPVDYSKVNDWVHASMWNNKDMEPDQINKDFKKVFSLEMDKYHVKIDVGAQLGGKVSIGPLSFGSDLKGTYSKDQLTELFRQHSFEAEIDGLVVKPKKLWLQIVNTADFARDETITYRRLYVGNQLVQDEVVDVELPTAIMEGAVQRDIPTRVAELEKNIRDLSLRLDKAQAAIGVLNGNVDLLATIGTAKAFVYYDSRGVVSQHNIKKVDELPGGGYKFHFTKSPGNGYVVLVSNGAAGDKPFVDANQLDSFVIKGADKAHGIFCVVFSENR